MKSISEIGWNATSAQGVVAAGQPAAVAAGLRLLHDGGNAVDAAVATILALSITDYGLFAIGGEVPFMFYNARQQQVKVLSGLGTAPRSPEAMLWYAANGIPAKSGIKSAPVPAALDLCLTALQLYGTMSFKAVVSPALELLTRQAEPWHANLAQTLSQLIETEALNPGAREQKLSAARDRFYRGDMADVLEKYYIANGSFLRKTDLALHTTRIEDAVSVHYADYVVYKCGPWTQGPVLCQALRLLEGFDLKAMGHLSPDYIHVVTEALKLALADRDEYYADPLFTKVPLEALLSDRYSKLRRTLIDLRRASSDIQPGDPDQFAARKGTHHNESWTGGTTTCVVGDRLGNVVAATPSANPPYAICEELGISHGTRLTSLNTTPGHPNRIEPGKRPRITLTPTLAVRADGSVLAISVAGGDLQDQTTLNCFLNHVEFGMTPAQAVTASRFSTAHHQDSFNPAVNREQTVVARASLTVNSGIGEPVVNELTNRGHHVTRTEGAIASPVMLYLDAQTRLAHAAGDPRAGRHAGAVD